MYSKSIHLLIITKMWLIPDNAILVLSKIAWHQINSLWYSFHLTNQSSFVISISCLTVFFLIFIHCASVVTYLLENPKDAERKSGKTCMIQCFVWSVWMYQYCGKQKNPLSTKKSLCPMHSLQNKIIKKKKTR